MTGSLDTTICGSLLHWSATPGAKYSSLYLVEVRLLVATAHES